MLYWPFDGRKGSRRAEMRVEIKPGTLFRPHEFNSTAARDEMGNPIPANGFDEERIALLRKAGSFG